MFRASASRVPSLCWMIWLHVLISSRIGHQIQHRRMHSNDSIYLIAPWASAYALGWSLKLRHPFKALAMPPWCFLKDFTALSLCDHLVSQRPCKDSWRNSFIISHLFGLEWKKTKTTWTVPKKVMASVQHLHLHIFGRIISTQIQGMTATRGIEDQRILFHKNCLNTIEFAAHISSIVIPLPMAIRKWNIHTAKKVKPNEQFQHPFSHCRPKKWRIVPEQVKDEMNISPLAKDF